MRRYNATSVVLIVLASLACASPLSGCAGKGPKPTISVSAEGDSTSISPAPGERRSLTQEEATIRHRQVIRPTYNLWFGIGSHGDEFEGRTVISFDLRPKARDYGKQVFLDFEDASIRSIKINGTPLPQAQIQNVYDGRRIHLRISDLLPGSNRVEVAYTHHFSKDGVGLNRFKDPEDGQVYLHSNLEPFGAHRVFPCFDQPDIKGSFEVTVEAPDSWQVIANMPERGISNVDGRKSWAFPPSPLISPYVFALVAGPYAQWKDTAEGIPLRLFARRSLADQMPDKEWTRDWFETVKKGIDYFSVQFGYPFPYPKYDQILVPEFSHGGMENVGAVTYGEHVLHRGRMTAQMKRGTQNLILHELAHMWFGNLVTMRWWNGIWLNESFATYAATQAAADSLGDKTAWADFFAGSKQYAYWEDQLITTHPVEGPVPDTDSAETVFDGISYGKGASVIKQLNAYLGEDDFREGLQRYFQKHALRNATLADFVSALSEASGRNLATWQKSWLQTTGVNTLRADWACEDNKVSRFVLLQGNSDTSQELRTHRTQIALYRFNQGALTPAETTAATYAGKETEIKDLIGKRCPDFAFPNHLDLDYIKVELDPKSLEFAKEKLSALTDPFARAMVWSSLSQMMVDGKLPAPEFAELVFRFAPKEREPEVLDRLLGQLSNRAAGSISVLRLLPPERRPDFLARLEKFLLKYLTSAPAGSDLQYTWYSHFLDAATSGDSIEFLMNLTHSTSKSGRTMLLKGFKLDPERRWEILFALARTGAITQERIDEELKADPTDMSRNAAIRASAALPDGESKKRWMSRIVTAIQDASKGATSTSPTNTVTATGEPKLSWSKLRSAMRYLNLVGQEPLIRQSADTYFEIIPKLADPALSEYAATFARSLYPHLCDAEIVRRTTETLEKNSKLPPSALKALRVGRQLEERCIRGRALITSGPQQ